MKRKRRIENLAIVLMFLSMSILTMSSTLKYNFHPKTIQKTINQNDLQFVFENPHQSSTTLNANLKQALDKLAIPQEAIVDVMNSKRTKVFISGYLSKLLNTVIYGQEEKNLTTDELKLLVYQNRTVIESALKKTNQKYTKEQEQKIINYIDQNGTDILEFFPTANQLLKKIHQENTVIYRQITLNKGIKLIRFLIGDLCFYGNLLLFGVSFLCFLISSRFSKKEREKKLIILFLSYVFVMIGFEIFFGTVLKSTFMNRLASASSFINYMINTASKFLWVSILPTIFLIIILYVNYTKKESEYEKISKRIYKSN